MIVVAPGAGARATETLAGLDGWRAAIGGSTRAGTTRKAPAAGKRKTAKVAPKYRNPDNPKETWTGRGKQPRWLAAYTAKGRDLGEFLIPGTAKPTPKPRTPGKKRVVKKAKK